MLSLDFAPTEFFDSKWTWSVLKHWVDKTSTQIQDVDAVIVRKDTATNKRIPSLPSAHPPNREQEDATPWEPPGWKSVFNWCDSWMISCSFFSHLF